MAFERYHIRQANYPERTPLSYFLIGSTRMEGALCLQLSRKAYHSHLTRIYNKVSEIMESSETPSDSQISTLKSSLEQLQCKAEIIRDLDAKIALAIQDPSELEGEIFESEMLLSRKQEVSKSFCHIKRSLEFPPKLK